jgi:hypothetical protein
VRAELRSLDSADAPSGLESFRPDNPETFSLAVGAIIGPFDGLGAELFYFNVCSPRWIEENPSPKGFEFMHSYLILSQWNYQTLHRALSDLCLHAEGDDWEQVATKLSRYGSWEFADYRDAR